VSRALHALNARFEAPFAVEQLVSIGNALNTGVLLAIDGSFDDTEGLLPTGLNGEDESWTLFAIGLDALFARMLADEE